MKLLTQTVASFLLVGALAGPAFAENETRNFSDNQIVITSPDGIMTRMNVADAAMLDMMMKEATPMTSGVLVMMHGGRMYTMTDHKMPNGKMMSDILAGK